MVVSFSAFAAPVKIPTLKICLAANGTMSAKTKCAKSETTASFSNFQSVGAQGIAGTQGPQGPQGPAGANGASITNLNQCAYRNGYGSGSSLTYVTAACLANEFVVTHGATTTDLTAIDSITLETGTNSTVGQVPQLVEYAIFPRTAGTFFNVTVSVFCCRGALL